MNDLHFHQLLNGLALRMYRLSNGRYAIVLWDTDVDAAAMTLTCAELAQAERIYIEQVKDCERYQ
jgi:hypothetical protein